MANRVATCDDAITDPSFWAFWVALAFISKILIMGHILADICPCHAHLLLMKGEFAFAHGLIQLWETCPMRTFNVPELSAGDFHDRFRAIAETTSAEVLIKLPNDIRLGA